MTADPTSPMPGISSPRPDAAPLFDVVVFDLDGTLVATDQFWIQAARTGARRVFAEQGLDRPIPNGEQWMSIVGKPLDAGFAELFADLAPDVRQAVQDACVAEGARLLDAGGAATMPGTYATLRSLRAAGVRIGVASNCSQGYLDSVLDRLELRSFVDEPRCLDSPGIGSKADMIEDLLATFGTRSAVMVGDRIGDRDAAWSNGIPHVHCAFGFAARGEAVEAEGCIEDLGALLELLGRRRGWILSALRDLGVLRSGRPPRVVAIGGPPLSGKTLFARDAARLLRAQGIGAAVVSLERFRRSVDLPGAGDLIERRYDLERACEELLLPHGRGEAVRLAAASGDEAPEPHLAPGDVLLLEGPFLHHPRLSPHFDRSLYLAAPESLSLRRALGRDGRRCGPMALEGLRAVDLPAHEDFEARYPASERTGLLLEASNPLGPLDVDCARGRPGG